MVWRFIKTILNPIIRNFYNLHTQGQENIPVSGGIILLGNQTNSTTAVATEIALQRKIYWAVSPSACKTKFFRFFLKILCGCFLLESQRPDIDGFRYAFDALKKSRVLSFYPGGVNPGIAIFCLRSGYDILPMAITQDASHPRNINITFGPTYNLSEYKKMIINVENVENIIQNTNQVIEKLRSKDKT